MIRTRCCVDRLSHAAFIAQMRRSHALRKTVQNRRKDLVHSAALQLDRDALIRYDRKSGTFQATDLGRIASQYYITHTTLREFNEHLKPTMGEIELLKIFCLADEFKYMVRRSSHALLCLLYCSQSAAALAWTAFRVPVVYAALSTHRGCGDGQGGDRYRWCGTRRSRSWCGWRRRCRSRSRTASTSPPPRSTSSSRSAATAPFCSGFADFYFSLRSSCVVFRSVAMFVIACCVS